MFGDGLAAWTVRSFGSLHQVTRGFPLLGFRHVGTSVCLQLLLPPEGHVRLPWEIPHSIGLLLLSLAMPVLALELGRAWLRSTVEDGVSPCVCWRHVG